jgi:hypothetical protein
VVNVVLPSACGRNDCWCNLATGSHRLVLTMEVEQSFQHNRGLRLWIEDATALSF